MILLMMFNPCNLIQFNITFKIFHNLLLYLYLYRLNYLYPLQLILGENIIINVIEFVVVIVIIINIIAFVTTINANITIHLNDINFNKVVISILVWVDQLENYNYIGGKNAIKTSLFVYICIVHFNNS